MKQLRNVQDAFYLGLARLASLHHARGDPVEAVEAPRTEPLLDGDAVAFEDVSQCERLARA
jgi:hypothetical protein